MRGGFLLDLAWFASGSAAGFTVLLRALKPLHLGHLSEKLFKRGELLAAAEEVGEDFVVDVGDERREDVEGFLLELDERVFLAVGAEVDAFFQGIECIQVFLPEAVDGVEEDHFFDLLESLGIGSAHF